MHQRASHLFRTAMLGHLPACRVQVLGEALLAAGYFAYLGPLPGSYRLQASASGRAHQNIVTTSHHAPRSAQRKGDGG